MSEFAIDRRRAILTLLAGAAGFAASGTLPIDRLFAAPAECPASLAGIEVTAAKALAQEYISMHPDDGVAIDRAWQWLARDERDTIRDRMTADYAEDRLVVLSGWWISQTEGRLLAAAAAHC